MFFHLFVNSGSAVVGRFALPMPLPACYIMQYELPAGKTIKVGTVAPSFGQAGGGVEIQLPQAQAVNVVGQFTVPEY